MKGITKSRGTVRIIALLFFAVVFVPGAAPTQAQAISPEMQVHIPAGRYKYGVVKYLIPQATLSTVKVRLRRLGSSDIFPNKKLKLVLSSNHSSYVTEELEVGSTFKTVTLTAPTFSASVWDHSCTEWTLSVKNTDFGSAADVGAIAFVTFSSDSHPWVNKFDKFGVGQSASIEKDIVTPGPGILTITATWYNYNPLNPNSYKLKFVLLRGNGTAATQGEGFGQNALFVSDEDKLKIKYRVTPSDLESRRWRIRVIGSSEEIIKDIIVTTVLVRMCP